jgi:hypothetical protein
MPPFFRDNVVNHVVCCINFATFSLALKIYYYNKNSNAKLKLQAKTGITLTMKKMKTILITGAILASTPLFAQAPTATDTVTPPQNNAVPYGDNPNIFKVITQKAQTTVQNTAEKVDHAAQKGIAKVKPKVENAWEETKDFATEKSAAAKEKSQQTAATVTQKLNQTKDGIMGSPDAKPAPIVSYPLSQSSTGAQAPIQ